MHPHVSPPQPVRLHPRLLPVQHDGHSRGVGGCSAHGGAGGAGAWGGQQPAGARAAAARAHRVRGAVRAGVGAVGQRGCAGVACESSVFAM